ncbi:MAG: polymerase III subunit beta protein [Candidatus Uhrbacteria bacterium GW2011_GWE2_45_35]|uniref:Beta sliding clamp n=2 Tax=Candidatus Uhriibacteriota TaxID=1752732 RepID=A0A0G1JJJ2_9BACT|nr:MAG: polymerase III subunit beta protein [Candidatus Uhrbacteria bacterium GW2011_GWF2_44_350]KKU09026.1 MAG: polymerase III subunit beta protein [Candidatus Uhrbacteria bacterium GW2011_GWE2_45_35]HBR81148.1 DNA polymerase III subunit beta [Candidatus Uhrbacteria bacterium]HCU31616.1 DNA polymerase III subunit beta [Candidatus Uhrbacteria bacterium]
MKVSCTKNNLQMGLSITSHLSTKNIQLPILNNVLMVAKNGNIRFTSTNLEIAVSCLVRGKVEEEGELTIPSKLFYDYISLLKEEKVDLFNQDQTLVVEAGDYKTKINGLISSDFPLVPSVNSNKIYLLPVNNFREALSQVVFAVASNESRPELSGVLLKFNNNELIIAATDSYRLAERKIKVSSENFGETTIIIPSRTIIEVNRILSIFKETSDSPSGVQISLSDNQVVFTYGLVEIISRTIEGSFPDYQQIVPKSFQTESKLDRNDFINAVKTASLFSRSGLFDVTVKFDPAGTFSAAAADATRGENTAVAKAEVNGLENSVTLNFRYLLDGLNSMTTESVVFQMIDGANPCMIHPVGSEDQHLYIVMPIRQ